LKLKQGDAAGRRSDVAQHGQSSGRVHTTHDKEMGQREPSARRVIYCHQHHPRSPYSPPANPI